MITALRETAIVSEDGRIELHCTQFRPGSRVEVIVLDEEADDAKWDRLLSDERKSASFARWAEQALAEGGETPLDPDKM